MVDEVIADGSEMSRLRKKGSRLISAKENLFSRLCDEVLDGFSSFDVPSIDGIETQPMPVARAA